MISALGSIVSQQSNATEKTMATVNMLLDYAASNPNAIIRYIVSVMKLYIHSDASYLSLPKARSRAGGFFFLSDKPVDTTRPLVTRSPLNGPLHIIGKIMCNVMGSAAESEIAASYLVAREAIPIYTTLNELGYTQSVIPIQVD
eukprot:CAMPEP_0197841784 /NCGR_PEP_ID=MMETSP1437-20131217/46376_1 /TAXON_ID=49252 ORGANISM="Eucampia antarctica, Strain CCMP1452" /NCGR_SAMPLE_ID=MMETSP1437 /ASSEMBLY_ACC=CAM_ASM_001096 /LENGTH=143 /DNA_ID=CAMNT_0043451585 /DNA_START=706 /DNA_END=1134 /DNA_ORIENTATION=+